MSLPDRHWKWRMRHAAIFFSEQLRQNHDDEFDLIVCSDMLNLAEFKGLAGQAVARVPTLVYFHENQFAYPNRQKNERDLHFAFTNLTSALAADRVWFNSEFNRSSMLCGYRKQRQHWPDFRPQQVEDHILAKSSIWPPGLDCREDRVTPAQSDGPIHLIWAARWEHDKNPADLLAALNLIRGKIEFQLSVIGQTYEQQPREFAEIHEAFCDHIVHWGFMPSRNEYLSALQSADVFVSTARHEFFGIAAAEAIATGLYPLLPNRLSYPELLEVDQNPSHAQYLYDGTPAALADKVIKLAKTASDGFRPAMEETFRQRFFQKHDWAHRAEQMDAELTKIRR